MTGGGQHVFRFNRELLASITFEPTPPSKRRTEAGAVPPTSVSASSGASHVTSPRSSDALAKQKQDVENQCIISCMKLALAKSIANISLPEKDRPLDPRKDFTIASKISFEAKVPKSRRRSDDGKGRSSKRGAHNASTSGWCCITETVKRTPAPLSSVRIRQPDAIVTHGAAAAPQPSGLAAAMDSAEDAPAVTPIGLRPPALFSSGSSSGQSGAGPSQSSGAPQDRYATRMIPVVTSAHSASASMALPGNDADTEENESEGDSEKSDDDAAELDASLESFTFTDYSPMCYRKIREFFHVQPDEYRKVICESAWQSVPTPGKSAAQLFFCGQNWVIKTMTLQESNFLRDVLHKYYYHVRDNPYTLLPHFVGHHRIRIRGRQPMTFLIMQNVFATPNKIHVKFDLKGSTVGRFATKLEKMKQTCTQKDLDINRPILVGARRRQLIVEQMKKDCDFLKRSSIMDYSLLVGIHVVSPGDDNPSPPPGESQSTANVASNPLTNPLEDEWGSAGNTAGGSGVCYLDGRAFTNDQGGMRSVDDVNGRKEIYYIGIIDILQEYTLWKRSETVVQGVVHDSQRISSVHPTDYASRFLSFMSSLLV